MAGADQTLEAVLDAYLAEHPRYERYAAASERILTRELANAGVAGSVTARAKDPRSFVKKAARGPCSGPMEQIKDKVGVRILLPFRSALQRLEPALETAVELTDKQVKVDALTPNQLGYLGVHYTLRLRPEDLTADEQDLAGLSAELQIHTHAEQAWAAISHDLLYKSVLDVPELLERRVNRLLALVEIFDDEAAEFESRLAEQPGFRELAILPQLEHELLIRVTTEPPDRALSALIIPTLVALYPVGPNRAFAECVEPWIAEQEETLKALFESRRDDPHAPVLLTQPEIFVICERLDRDRDRLKESWPPEMELSLLEDVAIARGVPL